MKNNVFLWTDKSGRGEFAKMDTRHIVSCMDAGTIENEQSRDGDYLRDYIESADMGDSWETHSQKYTRIL
jgi:hypothetical protein